MTPDDDTMEDADMFAVTRQGGQCMGMPDTCLTPAPPAAPVPIPYPNMASPTLATATTTKVLVSGMPALTTASTISLSSGDEAGSAGGVASGTCMGEMRFITGSRTVKLQGRFAARLGDTTRHNGGNTVGSVLAPSQTVVMIVS